MKEGGENTPSTLQMNIEISKKAKGNFFTKPQFYFCLIPLLITSIFYYFCYFEFPKFSSIINEGIKWTDNNMFVGLVLFFTMHIISVILCLPQSFQGFILSHILGRKMNIITCIISSSTSLLISDLVAGIITYSLTRIFKNSMKYS